MRMLDAFWGMLEQLQRKNGSIYVGQQPQGPFHVENDASSVVQRLIKPIDKSGRNITIDNFFTSIPLANDLFVNHRLTAVGTVRKNKPQIPQTISVVKDRPVHSSIFAYGKVPNNCTIVSLCPQERLKRSTTLHYV